MTELRKDVPRRNVIEAWIRYDANKKGKSVPDFSTWPWGRADELDQRLKTLGFKHGVIAGYLSWAFSVVTVRDLRRCAVVCGAIPDAPRCLGQLEGTGSLQSWQPHQATSWYERLSTGGLLTAEEPLLLRRSVPSESPADWYLEDGSGRGLAIIKASRHSADSVVAYAYVGVVPDRASTFMGQKFPGLLQ
jgi:hypothetical protein